MPAFNDFTTSMGAGAALSKLNGAFELHNHYDTGNGATKIPTVSLSGNIATSVLSGNIATTVLSGNVATLMLSGNIAGTNISGPVASATIATNAINSADASKLISLLDYTTTTLTIYTTEGAGYSKLYYWRSAYSSGHSIYLEAICKQRTTGTGYVRLYDLTAGSQIVEITNTSTSVNMITSGVITIPDGHIVRADIKSSSASEMFDCYSVYLSVR